LIGVGRCAGESPINRLCEVAATELAVRFVLGFGPDLPDGVAGLDDAPDDAMAPQGPAAAILAEPRKLAGAALIGFTARAGVPLVPIFHAEAELMAQGAMAVLALSLTRTDVILNPYPLTGPVGLGLALMPWLISGATLLQHQPFDGHGFRRQLLEGGATVTALPVSLLATLASEGVWRDPSCKMRRLGCVWPMAQSAEIMPELDGGATALFDVYPLGDLVSLIRMRAPGSDPARLPHGPIATSGEDGDSALFLEIALGAEDGAAPSEVKIRGPMVPHGSAGGPLAPDGQGFIGTGLRARLDGPAGALVALCRDPELIHHGGLTIAASELDGLYRSVPGVGDACCFVLPDPIVGDPIAAAIVPQTGHSVSLDAPHGFLGDTGVAPYKFPDRLVVVSAIPRDSAGRVLRDRLLRAVL
jgi:mycobactin salicyl-AMP ligase